MSYREFAREIGVTPAAVLKMEQPGNFPAAEKLPAIADALKVPIDALYGRKPPKP